MLHKSLTVHRIEISAYLPSCRGWNKINNTSTSVWWISSCSLYQIYWDIRTISSQSRAKSKTSNFMCQTRDSCTVLKRWRAEQVLNSSLISCSGWITSVHFSINFCDERIGFTFSGFKGEVTVLTVRLLESCMSHIITEQQQHFLRLYRNINVPYAI